jgi:hypothetical protein
MAMPIAAGILVEGKKIVQRQKMITEIEKRYGEAD